jgi:hypothetical protein
MECSRVLRCFPSLESCKDAHVSSPTKCLSRKQKSKVSINSLRPPPPPPGPTSLPPSRSFTSASDEKQLGGRTLTPTFSYQWQR